MMNDRQRAGTEYYDAQPNFGTPPMSSSSPMRQPHAQHQEEIYEVVQQQRRVFAGQRHDGRPPANSNPSQFQNQEMRRAPAGSMPMVTMPPAPEHMGYASPTRVVTPSGGRSTTPSRHLAGARPPPPDYHQPHQLDFVPVPRTGNVMLPAYYPSERRGSGQRDRDGPPQANYIRRTTVGELPYPNRTRDFGVVGSYAEDRDRGMYVRAGQEEPRYKYFDEPTRVGSAAGSYRQRRAPDPRLNVTHPHALPTATPPDSRSHLHLFHSESTGSRHLYEELPTAISFDRSAYEKETAILDDDDGRLAASAARKPRNVEADEGNESDAHSGVYQAGKYQPSEDAGSSSDEDDPEFLEFVERENIIHRYENGPDSADVDAWENPKFDVYAKLDRHGFVRKDGEQMSEEENAHRRRVVRELRREKKWLKMTDVWKGGGGPSKKMEDRIWKGIPEKMRLVVWPRLLGADRLLEEKRDVYKDLLLRARLVSKDIKQIDLDINRTYRDHLAFRKRYDIKQKSLLNVLAAYSMYNTEVGYCQGMSQIAALFLMYLDEEETFWCLHSLMVSPKHTMHGFFVPGFPKLQRFEEHFKRVLKKYKPRVYKHLEKQDIPYIYLTKWWFGCFLDRVPFSLALRLWDVFLIVGDPILIAMSLNIMKMHERTIRKQSMETFMEFVQNSLPSGFGYSDDEVMHSLRETLTKLQSDRQHVPPPPSSDDLSEVPTKALGPILQKPIGTIREEINEIQSRKSRANSTGRSPHPKRKESARNKNGPPPVTHKWNGNSSQDSIVANGKEVPFEIPTRRVGPATGGTPPLADAAHHRPSSSSNSSLGRSGAAGSAPGGASKPSYRPQQQQQHAADPSRAGGTPRAQRLRDERNGQMVTISRASDSDASPPPSEVATATSTATALSHHYQHDQHHQQYQQQYQHRVQMSSGSVGGPARITHAANHVTRIELDDENVSVI